jgi:hypothetical protein
MADRSDDLATAHLAEVKEIAGEARARVRELELELAQTRGALAAARAQAADANADVEAITPAVAAMRLALEQILEYEGDDLGDFVAHVAPRALALEAGKELLAAVESLRVWIVGVAESATCAFCSPEVSPEKVEAMRVHALACSKHPLRALAESSTKVAGELVALREVVKACDRARKCTCGEPTCEALEDLDTAFVLLRKVTDA